jgi:hypothetical protein
MVEFLPKSSSAVVESLNMDQSGVDDEIDSKVENSKTQQNFSDSSSIDKYSSNVKIQMKKLGE